MPSGWRRWAWNSGSENQQACEIALTNGQGNSRQGRIVMPTANLIGGGQLIDDFVEKRVSLKFHFLDPGLRPFA